MEKFLDAIKFHHLLRKEVLSSQEDKIKKYYRNILNNPKKYYFYSFGWSKRVEYLTKNIENKNSVLLDAGCGLGTESIYFASLGMKVVSIDLNDSFIELAKKRKEYYEKKLNENLDIDFYATNIFDIKNKKFDVIWLSEAISHIFPPEEFLKKSHSLLNPKGAIFISDTNSLNPIVQAHTAKQTKKVFRKNVIRQHPITGKLVEEANENLLNPFKISFLLKNIGYKDVSYEYSMFLPPVFLKNSNAVKKAFTLEKNINKYFPGKHFAGAIYNISALRE
jgi:2-polyprenyl-3-methyl-5-hydroxy-6-metoxy-1,4-benzoquinol methylase